MTKSEIRNPKSDLPAEALAKAGIIKIVVVEDNDTIREGLKILIDGTKGFSCLAVFPDSETLIKHIKNLCPDVLLIDIGLPGMNGIEGIKHVKAILPELIILVLTVYEENDLIFSALCAGASGYIAKKTPSSKLLIAVKEAYQGYTPMSSKIASMVIKLFRQKKQVNNGDISKIELTKREKEILNKLVEGSSVKAIADSLIINMDTLGSDFKSIYSKLHSYFRLYNINGAVKN
jgi:DNA-binding NarL/FixJ family response regulator